MGDDAPFRNYYTDFRAEDRTSKTFLGGMRFAARRRLFLFIGVIALAALGGLFYLADQRASEAVDGLIGAQRLAGLITRIETGSLETHSDSRNFFLSRNLQYAETYQKRAEPLLSNLERLYGLKSAENIRKHVATVNDGVAQHANQFGKVVEIQKVLGLNQKSGLVRLLQSSVDDLDKKIRGLGSADLSRRLAEIRHSETNVLAAGSSDAVKRVDTQLGNLQQAVTSAAFAEADKLSLGQLINSYKTDIGQYARTRSTLRQEIGRLTEINTYMAPSLAALTTFADETIAASEAQLAKAQQLLRAALAGGTGGAILVLLTLGWLLLRSVTSPVAEIADAATRLAHGDRGVSIPALGNYDETGEIANALTFFRDNMAQTDRLRKELEESLQASAHRQPIEVPAAAPPAIAAPVPEPTGRELTPSSGPDGFVTTPISEISRQVTETSQNASMAAFEAERTETMVNGLAAAMEKMASIQRLVAAAGDTSSLLAVQTAIDQETTSPRDENLIVLPASNRGDETARPDAGQSAEGRAGEILSSIKAAASELEELDRILRRVNEVSIEFAAEASTQALQSATELLRQSEDLRGMLDDLLGKIRLEDRNQRGGGTADGEV